MIKGGYSLIDCTGFDLANPVSVDGIYEKMKTAYDAGKVIFCANMKNGAAHFTPIPAFLATETVDSKIVYILTIMNLPYRISDDDTISQS